MIICTCDLDYGDITGTKLLFPAKWLVVVKIGMDAWRSASGWTGHYGGLRRKSEETSNGLYRHLSSSLAREVYFMIWSPFSKRFVLTYVPHLAILNLILHSLSKSSIHFHLMAWRGVCSIRRLRISPMRWQNVLEKARCVAWEWAMSRLMGWWTSVSWQTEMNTMCDFIAFNGVRRR